MGIINQEEKTQGIDFVELQSSLYYLHVNELKSYCERLILSTKGKKVALIARIIHFLKTGEKIDLANYPEISRSRGQKNKELRADLLMLKGGHKNDLRTRLFLKGIIGEHFHFTAFGIDLLEERWMDGNPPTYQEFADMWQKEFEVRKANGSRPKEEWAYINFVKRYISKNPKAERSEILSNWERERTKHKGLANKILMECIR